VTPEVAQFLRNLLTVQQISVGDPNFAETSSTVIVALKQLDLIIAQETS